MLVAISEDPFYRARTAATAHTNTFASEIFVTTDVVFARVKDRHFRITGLPLSHAARLTLIGRSVAWCVSDRPPPPSVLRLDP